MNLDKEKIMKSVDEIQTRYPFNDIHRPETSAKKEILEHMLAHGYDHSYPILLWEQGDVVVDGHTRLEAAIEAGITEVPVMELEFIDELEAYEYAVHSQCARRNLSGSDLLGIYQNLNYYKQRGERSDLAPPEAKSPGKSAQEVADLMGTSRSMVERLRTIDNFAPDDLKTELKAGKKSVFKVYQETQEQRKQEELEKQKEATPPKPPKPMFNKTTIQEPCDLCGHTIKDSIEWAYYTWNPATGCHHGCPYCYARDIANRFYTDYPLSERFDYHFHPERLDAIKNMTIPKNDIVGEHNVFVCSMADLFGDWVPQEDIDKVFSAIEEAPDWWNFLFLTKNPKRYLELEFPIKSWIGMTADTQARAEIAVQVAKDLKEKGVPNITFLSCEPLMEEITVDLSSIDWLILGGRSGNSNMPAFQPQWSWVESLLLQAREVGCKVYFKPNLEVRPREYPTLD